MASLSLAALLACFKALFSLPLRHPRLKRGADGRIIGVLVTRQMGFDEAVG